MKLGKRLATLCEMVSNQYDHIWDCCCDHGFLGAALLKANNPACIHFVDIVPNLMLNVEQDLIRFFPERTWKTHCQDVAALPLAQFNGRHLVIIAGVGGDLMQQMIKHLFTANSALEFDLLLCPVHHQYAIRQQLIAFKCELIDEQIVEENQRFYELILVRKTISNINSSSNIHPVGDKLWQGRNEAEVALSQAYLTKTLLHYQRIKQGNSKNVDPIIAAYQAIKILDIGSN